MKQTNKLTLSIILLFMAIGIVSLFFGIKGKISLAIKTMGYKSTTGILSNKEIYSLPDDGRGVGIHSTTYSLIYSYNVDNKKYTIVTDYGTTSVPEMGIHKTIKYNPDDPNEAIISGIDGNGLMIIFGLGFIVLSNGLLKLGIAKI